MEKYFLNRACALSISIALFFTGAMAKAQDVEPVAVAVAVESEYTGNVVLERIQSRLDPNACTESARNSIWLKKYIHRPEKFSQFLESILPMLDFVSHSVVEKNLPIEFALIPFVESRYNPNAHAGGPVGLWQLIPNTAKHYGLKTSGSMDERFSVIASTGAATRYLESIHRSFKDWPTTLMAYNAGDTRVRNGLRRQKLDVADAMKQLPRGLEPHTYAYVRKIQAIACLFQNPGNYAVNFPVSVEFIPLKTRELIQNPPDPNQ